MVADGAVSLSCSQEKKTENDSSVCPTEGEEKSIRPNNPSPNICPPRRRVNGEDVKPAYQGEERLRRAHGGLLERWSPSRERNGQ